MFGNEIAKIQKMGTNNFSNINAEIAFLSPPLSHHFSLTFFHNFDNTIAEIHLSPQTTQ